MDDQDIAESLDVVALVALEAHLDRKTLRGPSMVVRDVLAAEAGLDDVQHVCALRP